VTSSVPFVELLDPSARAELARAGTRRRAQAGACLLLEGETANRIGFLHEGLVKVTVAHVDGYEVVLAVLGPGELLGEVAAFDGGIRGASATALSPCDVQFVPVDEFEQLMSRHPAIGAAIVRTLAARLRAADAHRLSSAADGVPRRLARALLQLAQDHGRVEGDAIEIDLALTQDELAGLVGASRDSVSKALKGWREQGLVETRRRRIVLADPAALSRQQRI
jgi:CRP-like cAMP-binding protein